MIERMVSSMAKTAESVPVKKTAWQKFWKRNRGLLYVLPWLLGFLCFKCYPFFSSFIYSLKDFNLFKGDADFIGLGNYIKIFNTKKYMKAYLVTFKYAFITVPLKLIFSLSSSDL